MKEKVPPQAALNTMLKRELEAIAAPALSQGEQSPGLIIEMSQQADFEHVQIVEERHYAASLGIWAPVICTTQVEADYLTGLCLVLGHNAEGKIFVRGITEEEIRNHYGIETPPTYVRIPCLP